MVVDLFNTDTKREGMAFWARSQMQSCGAWWDESHLVLAQCWPQQCWHEWNSPRHILIWAWRYCRFFL